MPASKSCPTCHQAWAATFKFCPKDGTSLVEVSASRPAATQDSRTILTPILAAPPLRAPPEAQRAPLAALDAAIARARPSNTRPRKAEPRLFNLEPVHVEAAPVEPPPPSAPASVVERPPARGPQEGRPIGRKKRGDFSETAWFMRPDQPVDPKTGRVRFDPKAYARDESIPEEKRRRFSLRRKDEE